MEKELNKVIKLTPQYRLAVKSEKEKISKEFKQESSHLSLIAKYNFNIATLLKELVTFTGGNAEALEKEFQAKGIK